MKGPLSVVGSLLMVAMMTACSPPGGTVQAPPATPKPTPHPATGAQARAIQIYPDLGVKNSLLNKTFLELREQTAEKDPLMLTRIDWPITLAHQAAKILDIPPAAPAPVAAAPGPEPSFSTEVEPPSNPLERGSYNQSRPKSRAYYYNGNVYYR